jgi:hypothetical protein
MIEPKAGQAGGFGPKVEVVERFSDSLRGIVLFGTGGGARSLTA